jgi:lipopolysaccharide export system permease protein
MNRLYHSKQSGITSSVVQRDIRQIVRKELGGSIETPTGIKFLPIGGIVDRYLVQGFLRVFFVSLVGVTAMYLVVEFFDRIGTFLATGTPLWTAVRYFLYKLPLSISRVLGFVALFSTLFCLGMLVRTQEVTALRTGGLSVFRISLPLLLLSFVICLGTFFWNESLVPIFAHKAQTIYKTEVKSKQPQSLFGTRDIWIRGEGSFINVDHFDTKKGTLQGISVFSLNRDFNLTGLIEIPGARWTGAQWEASGATEWHFLENGKIFKQNVAASVPIFETPEDLKLLAREPEEFTFFDLQKQIVDLKNKGIDATPQEVDLQVKLALPFIAPLMVLLAIPFALKGRVGGGIARSFGVAMLLAFAYWVVAAFCVSLGHNNALPPWVAAWLPNLIFGFVGLFFYTAEE